MPGQFAAGAEATVVGQISGQATANVLHFSIVGPADVTDPNIITTKLRELAEAIHDCIVETFIPAATSDWTYLRTEVREKMLGTGIEVTNDSPAPVVGTAGVQGVNVASQLIHVRTGAGGRNGRGRNFWAPAGENVATQGEWDPAALVLLAAFAACMATKFIGPEKTTEWSIGVLSRSIFGGVLGNWDAAFFEAINLEPEVIISTMGTRRKGRGA